ncbi:MAG: GNAT family N-acetyltransferase [Gammaproteobacteria bacterium]|nr:GNAT family N-acetyltransferase [Gammaproteobacteria bacterium]
MITRKWLPDNFVVPEVLETDKFRLRMLTVHDLIKDYDAVMSSVDHLQGVFGPGDSWPRELTLEKDLVDLGWHQCEFQNRSSFAYTVMSLDEAICLGCVYIYPSNKLEYEAEVYMWVRASEAPSGLDTELFRTTKDWITSEWPMKKVAYPIREIDWSAWESIPEK